jgi:hypothetical protein
MLNILGIVSNNHEPVPSRSLRFFSITKVLAPPDRRPAGARDGDQTCCFIELKHKDGAMKRLLLAITVVGGMTSPATAESYNVYSDMDGRCLIIYAEELNMGRTAKSKPSLGVIQGINGIPTFDEAVAILKPCTQRRQEAKTKFQEIIAKHPQMGENYSNKYFILQEMPSHSCHVVDAVPEELGVVRGGPGGFATREEAEAKLTELCKQVK